jgi:hypothetical protein
VKFGLEDALALTEIEGPSLAPSPAPA